MKKVNSLLVFLFFAGAVLAQRNVVLILADDVSTDYFGFYEDHQDTAAMPNIRTLLAKGVRFSNAISNPICSPTRAGMLTGRYSFRTGVGTAVGGADGGPSLDMNETTLPQLLENYQPNIAKANIGKWHLHNPQPGNLMNPNLLGYDYYSGLFIGGLPDYFNWTKVTNGVSSTVTTYATTETVNDAISWTSAQNSPFFLWLAFNAPHTPFHLPPAGLHSYTNLSGTTQDIAQNPKPYFKASLEALDHEIGRLFASLKAQNKFDNTDFIFIGDNGSPRQVSQSINNSRSKGTIYQDGVHIPMIIAGPSVQQPGRVSDALVHTTDLFATILELFGDSNWKAQIPAEKPVDSHSILPILNNTCGAERPWVFTEIFKPTTDGDDGKAIQSGAYKLLNFDDGHSEFYKLSTDPTELMNLLNGSLTATDQANFNYLSNEMKLLTGVTTPPISAWLRNVTGIKGRHYVQGNGTPIQDNVLANVQSVQYSNNWVYVQATGIPSYITGPFLDGNPSLATAQTGYFKLPLNPAANTGTPTNTTGGNIGIFINGVALFDYRDGVAWNANTNALCGGPGNPPCAGGMATVQPWNRDAIPAEKNGFDCAKGHPAMGNYHHHQNPSAFNLDLSVISTICDVYLADGLYTLDSTKHSPLIGYAYDGFPIYGAYGYKNADGTGAVTRIKSSYTLRNISVRTHHADGTDVADGPAVSATYPLGYFREDYQYNATSTATPDFLDDHNGRFCITPEYPQGTYAYFTTVNTAWNSAYPYVVGPTFYGNKTATKVTNITEPVTTYTGEALAATSTICPVECFGGATGGIKLFVNGGTAPYSFNWGNGITSQDRSGLSAGTYTVTITDGTGQTLSQSATVPQPATGISASAAATNVACYGSATGAIQLTLTGGNAGYAFLWNDGNTVQNRINLSAGSYTVTITNSNGCTTSLSQNVAQPTVAFVASATVQNVACFGTATGAIQLTPSGGTAGYTYAWADGANTQNRSGLAAGNYSVTLTDAKNCTTTFSQTILQPQTALATTAAATHVACFGTATGVIQLTPSGGTAGYTYLWSNGSTSQNINALSAGTYTATLSDAQNCTTTISRTISQPQTALAAMATATNVACFGNATGAIQLTPSGGTAGYSYIWSNGSTSQNINALSAGIYSATLSDVQNCMTTLSQTISQPQTALSAMTTATNVACFGGTTGAIQLTPSGGTAGYSYLWSNGLTSQNLNTVTAGTYTATVSDAQNCTTTLSQSITQAAEIMATLSATDASCGMANGALDLTANGGNGAFSYVWSNGSTIQNISGLSAGSYTVTISDASACTKVVTEGLSNLGAPSVNLVVQNVSCFGGANGSLTLNISNGTPPYAYSWNDGTTTQNRQNLSTGNYIVTVLDANNCATVVTKTVQQPSILSISSNATPNACGMANIGAIAVQVSGGTLPYTYVWSNGMTSQNISGLASGTYTITVSDANACTKAYSTTVAATNAPNATVTATSVRCFGDATGSIQLNVTGGTAPLSFLWNTGSSQQNISNLVAGTYTVTITDANGCTSSIAKTVSQAAALLLDGTIKNIDCFGAASGSIALAVSGGTSPFTALWDNSVVGLNNTSLMAGTYTATITDANGCTSGITSTVSQPSTQLSIVPTVQDVDCFGNANGAIQLATTGGTGALSYQWNNGASTKNLSNLPAGVYTVTLTDANGCTAEKSSTVQQPNLLTATATATNISCFGASTGGLTLSPMGGTQPYSYTWSTSASTANLQNLSVGTYSVTVLDAHGCSATDSKTLSQPTAALSVMLSTTASSGADGTANAMPTGGTMPYTYAWNTGNTTSQQVNLAVGTYTVTIADANGCTTSGSAVVDMLISTETSFGTIDLNVFPNPTSEILIVQAKGLLQKTLRLQLSAENGQVLLENELAAGSTLAFLNTETLYEGIYFLSVSDGRSKKTFKVVVVR